jgi:hypothetical protein
MKKNYFRFLATFLVMLIGFGTIAQVNITLRVDMQDETVSLDGVHVAGSFQGWNPATTEMTPPALGSIYVHTFQANPGEQILYKFINGNDWAQQEIVPPVCGEPDGYGGYNRLFIVPDEDAEVDLVCFGACLPCVLPEVDVTFQVDMSNETVNTGVFLAGSFNGWSPTTTEMTPVGNDVYAYTLTLGAGEYYEYKFVNSGNWEGVPGLCAANNNRYLIVPETNTTLEAVCFGSCDPCSSVVNVTVKFQVDMSEVAEISANGVHIAGGFQGWNPGSTSMTDIGNGIYEYAAVLQSGTYHEYKFINGNIWDDAESVPGECAANGNRFLTVPEADITLDAVCFGSCVVCNPPLYNVTFKVDMSTQIVSPEGVHLMGSFQDWDPAATEMITTGNNIYEVTIPIGEGELHEYKFVNGNTYDGAEFVPGECSNFDGNREIFGPSTPQVLDAVCFGECEECQSTLYTFNLKVFLEGSFNGINMNTELFDNGLLPVEQPFNAEPWNYDGLQTLTAPSEADVVDWLYIQLRETDGDASTATPDKLLDHQAVIVLSDGSVATPDGNPHFYYNGNIMENLYIVVYSRNHLAVMTSTPVLELSGTYSYNFSNGISKAYSFNADGHKLLGGGIYGMIGGDGNADGIVDINDKDMNWMDEAGKAGLSNSDLNLDGQVNNQDKNDVWDANNGMETQVPQ